MVERVCRIFKIKLHERALTLRPTTEQTKGSRTAAFDNRTTSAGAVLVSEEIWATYEKGVNLESKEEQDMVRCDMWTLNLNLNSQYIMDPAEQVANCL